MTEARDGNGKLGAPADAVTTFFQTAIDAAKQSAVEPATDPRVSAAFALGWQMAELYRAKWKSPGAQTAAGDLPGVGRLQADERVEIAVRQLEAGVAKLADAIRSAGLQVPPTEDVRKNLTPPVDETDRIQAVREFHVQLLSSLTAADFRLGKAYGLGRALADTCRSRGTLAEVQAEFKAGRIAKIRSWLDDLASAFPAHAAKSVGESLGRWATSLSPPDGKGQGVPDDALKLLRRQGQLWRALLSGEKSGPDMLEINNYLDAATGLLITMRGVARRFILRLPFVALAIVILFGGGIALIVTTKTTASFVAGAAGILASLGLSWKSVGGALGGVTARLERRLWNAELDTAIADAITLLPEDVQQKLTRREKTQQRRELAAEVTDMAPEPTAGEKTASPQAANAPVTTA
jgi:hypothetical protein